MRTRTGFSATIEDELARFLRRGADLVRTLPNQTAVDFPNSVKKELARFAAPSIQATEVERLVRLGAGQQTFRRAMLDY